MATLGFGSFSPRDFIDLGGRATIDSALHRFQQKGTIGGGHTGSLRLSTLQRALKPGAESGRRPSGPGAGAEVWLANPARRSDGPKPHRLVYPGASSRGVLVGWSRPDLPDRQHKPCLRTYGVKETGFKLRESGLIVQALKSLGPDRVNTEVIFQVRDWLPEKLRAKVLRDAKTATGWVYSAIQRIARQESNG